VVEQETFLALNESFSGNEIARLECDVNRLSEGLTVLESKHTSELKTVQESFQTRENQFFENLNRLCQKNDLLQNEVKTN